MAKPSISDASSFDEEAEAPYNNSISSDEDEQKNEQVNEDEDKEELEAVARTTGSDDEEEAVEENSQSKDDDDAMSEDKDGNTSANAEIGTPEKSRLTEMQKLKKQKIQELLNSQNAAIDADMNKKGKDV